MKSHSTTAKTIVAMAAVAFGLASLASAATSRKPPVVVITVPLADNKPAVSP